MELTLTGASLSSNRPEPKPNISDEILKSLTGDSHNNNQCDDKHKSCCAKKDHSNDKLTLSKFPVGVVKVKGDVNANEVFQRLLSQSNVEDRSAALATAVKVGHYEGFERLCNAIIGNEKEKSKNEIGSDKDDNKVDQSSELCRYLEDHSTLAHWAAKRDDPRFLEYLTSPKVPGGLDMLNLPSDDVMGMRPIHWAASKGSIPVVAVLLQQLQLSKSSTTEKVNIYKQNKFTSSIDDLSYDSIINVRDKNGNTPLIIAAQYGHADLCAFLIKRGADPSAVDESQDSAMHWAAYKGVTPVIGLLCHIGWNHTDHNQRQNKRSQQEVQHFHHEIIRHKKWLSLEAVDVYGQSPLHLASLRGNAEAVQYILEEALNRENAVRDIHSIGKHGGKNSRYSTNSRQETDQVRYLLTLPDKDGKTPLDLAIKKQKASCVIVLQEWEERLSLGMYSNKLSLPSKLYAIFKPFFSVKQWKLWMGFGFGRDQDASALQQQNMKGPFIICSGSMFVGFLIDIIKFTPVFNTDKGLLWDFKFLHIFHYLSVLCTFYTFFKTWTTNPGVLGDDGNMSAKNIFHIPFMSKNANKQRQTSSRASTSHSIEESLSFLTTKYRSQYDEILESYATSSTEALSITNNNKNPISLCHSCHIARPFRSKHCRVRRRCVLMFDHFCPFVGNVVGLYNYIYFYFFLVSLVLSEISFLFTTVFYLHRLHGDDWPLYIFTFYTILVTFMSEAMLGYHTQLIKRELTTNEHQNLGRYGYLKNDRNEYHNPWNRGFFRNLLNRFFPSEALYTISQLQSMSSASDSCVLVQHGGGDESARADSEKKDLLSHQV